MENSVYYNKRRLKKLGAQASSLCPSCTKRCSLSITGKMPVPPARQIMIFLHTLSEAQFDALVRGHFALFRKLALRILKNREDADDAVQNALLKGWRRRLFLRNRERLVQWIYTIVINESYNILRNRLDDKKLLSSEHPDTSTTNLYEYEERFQRLDMAIASLPEIYRETVHIALLSGVGNEEAAALLGCSQNTLYQRIHKAKQLLREALKDE